MRLRPSILAAALAIATPLAASAQSIRSAPVTPVPVSSPWLLLALWLALLAGGIWMLRSRRPQARALALACLAAAGLWLVQGARAQVSLDFSDPDGETLAVPVNQILSGGDIQGFQYVEFSNASGVSLRIAGIVEPDFDDCFPGGLDEPLPPPGSSSGATVCALDLVLVPGGSCQVDVDAICRAHEAATDADINVSPATLAFIENTTGTVTVTNDAASRVPARDVAATIPGGSSFSVQSTTCGASLAPGASCSITFTNATTEGPTTVPIAGSNTDTETVDVTTVSSPLISITGPVQQSRIIGVSGAALSLEITNDAGSAINATGITVTNKAAAPNVVVDDSDCVTVAPGASCTLELTSPTPYAPATITIGGSNTANAPTTLVVFSHLGGLVFAESGGSGKVVIDVAQEFTSAFVAGPATHVPSASSFDDGVSNTDAIVAEAACSNDAANCAAQRCRDIGADWHLPARGELAAIHIALCSNLAVPCTAGGFSSADYWSSTASGATVAFRFPSFQPVSVSSFELNPVRCVRPF